MPKFNKMYFPVDAIAKHEDFDVWYSDGERALRFEGPWEKESDRIGDDRRMAAKSAKSDPTTRHSTIICATIASNTSSKPASSRSTIMSRACCGTSTVA